jgi:hypothetical protein
VKVHTDRMARFSVDHIASNFRWHVFLTSLLLVPTAALSTTFNVRDYGVVGEGTAADVARIQNILGLAKMAGGGDIYFPKGIYLVPKDGFLLTLDGQQELTIRGDGPGFTLYQTQQPRPLVAAMKAALCV